MSRWRSVRSGSAARHPSASRCNHRGPGFDAPIALPDDYMLPVVNRIAEMLRSGRGMGRDALLAPVRMMTEINGLLAG